MRTLVIGDIHGAHLALEQCLERCGFNKAEDQLIVLGDVCDGWAYVRQCVDILLTVKNRIDILGNHDEWFRRWLQTGRQVDMWSQGGKGTVLSYAGIAGRDIELEEMTNWRPDSRGSLRQYSFYRTSLTPNDIPPLHWNFFNHMNLYYKDDKRNAFFVHAGFDRFKSISENRHDHPMEFYWDRKLWDQAKSCKGDQKLQTVDDFDRIYIGHTAVEDATPVFKGGVWNLDTGAGWSGKLTIMEVDTNEYWQSDIVTSLYPEDFKNR